MRDSGIPGGIINLTAVMFEGYVLAETCHATTTKKPFKKTITPAKVIYINSLKGLIVRDLLTRTWELVL